MDYFWVGEVYGFGFFHYILNIYVLMSSTRLPSSVAALVRFAFDLECIFLEKIYFCIEQIQIN